MHLLATQSLSLDEADVAVDLEQTPCGRLSMLSFGDGDTIGAGGGMARAAR